VVHRDIKPANVMVDGAGAARLTDFGLAKATREEGTLTSADQVMGTARYMPPEQTTGMADVDHRSDVYSLGAVLYELIAGRRPFTGPTLAAILLSDLEQRLVEPPAEGDTTPDSERAVLRRDTAWLLARCHARLGRTDEAFAAVERALAAGSTLAAGFETHDGLVSLRADRRWGPVVEKHGRRNR
jgi:serine/threonine protein kinase